MQVVRVHSPGISEVYLAVVVLIVRVAIMNLILGVRTVQLCFEVHARVVIDSSSSLLLGFTVGEASCTAGAISVLEHEVVASKVRAAIVAYALV